MTRAQRRRRVFRIDVETCSACGGPVRVIASIEDPVVIEKILAHLGESQARPAMAPADSASPDFNSVRRSLRAMMLLLLIV